MGDPIRTRFEPWKPREKRRRGEGDGLTKFVPKQLLGLNEAYCGFCKGNRIISESRPYFCLTCGHYIKINQQKRE